jgi:hypothetical protein
MLSLDDNRWNDFTGGYRIKCDPRPLLAELERAQNKETAWHGLWEELHHQGDVGEASYASVPHLVRIDRTSGIVDWNTYAIVAIIALGWEGQKSRGADVVGRGLPSGDPGTGGNWCW